MSERAFAPDTIKNMAENDAFVSFDVIQYGNSEMRSHWYRYRDIDLYYFQTTDGDVAKIHITIFGQVVEWNKLDGVRTGLLIEHEGEAGVSEIVQYDARPNTACVKQAMDVLTQARKIEKADRERLLARLGSKANPPGSLWRKFFRLLGK
jgi:hypothetical protein